MLIEQIADKKIVRKVFDEEKELKSKQFFDVGELKSSGDKLSVNLQVKIFDEDGKLEEKYFTHYTCKPEKSDVLLNVFPFAQRGDAKYVIEASSYGFKNLYQFKAEEKKLKDLSLKMSVESGMLGFFGSKNKIKLSHRRVNKTASGFDLQSHLTIKVYMMGLNIKTESYQVTEKLNDNKILLSQEFMSEDGSYFLMNY
ncbi:hypothetical protein G3567_09810 [Psychroflexus sp. YR1-1]|nr:hypothetical protein [Psychroflexus aurantiacus]NEV94436.1 hypothetical protein [Psychroflexus aurantiacus]